MTKRLYLTLAIALSGWLVRADIPIEFGPVTNSVTGSVYYLLQAATWEESKATAEKLGGNLVTINDELEQQWVFELFGYQGWKPRALWIGLTDRDTEGTFTWISGQPVNFTHWGGGEPNNFNDEDFVHMRAYDVPGSSGQWNDLNQRTEFNGAPLHGVVEIEMEVTEKVGPVIVRDLRDQRVFRGSTVRLDALGIGSGWLRYEWFHNNSSVFWSTTNSWLELQDLSEANEGQYQVLISNDVGSVLSRIVSLEIEPDPFSGVDPPLAFHITADRDPSEEGISRPKGIQYSKGVEGLAYDTRTANQRLFGTRYFPGRGNWSFSVWLNWRGNLRTGDGLLRSQDILFLGHRGRNGFGLMIPGDNIANSFPHLQSSVGKMIVLVGGVQFVTSNITLRQSVWTHIAVTLADGVMRVYQDGQLQFSDQVSLPRSPDDKLYIGWFNGAVDEVAFFEAALSPTEVNRIYQFGLPSSAPITLDLQPFSHEMLRLSAAGPENWSLTLYSSTDLKQWSPEAPGREEPWKLQQFFPVSQDTKRFFKAVVGNLEN